METTEVNEIINKALPDEDEEDDSVEDNLQKRVTNLSYSLEKRINALEQYYSQHGDNTIEILRTLSSMYQMSGSKLIERFFYIICSKALISPFLKIEAAKCLLDYEEISDEDRAEEVKENNDKRKIIGYKALEHVCHDLSTMPAPCRIQAIFMLMNSNDSRSNADFYFKEFVNSDIIECDFRYTTILSLEKIGSDEMKQELYEYCTEKEIEKVSLLLSQWFTRSMKKTTKNCFYIIARLSYEDTKNLYTVIFPTRECKRYWFIKSAFIAFIFHNKNPVYFRNLAGQYLLKNSDLSDEDRFDVEKNILEFAEDKNLEYNLRADAADILLRFGSETSKNVAKDIIMQLAQVNGPVRTLFDNAQNVHIEEVDESVAEVLEFLSSFPIYIINNNPIDFEYVNSHVEKMLKEQTDRSEEFLVKNEKIRIAMKRIFMDRALYSKFNNSLLNILLKIYTYIQMQEDDSIKIQLYTRMLQELEDMSGTCSSGFAARIVNIISGYDNFNIRMSFNDQIIANFTGRLNAAARKITLEDSIFRTTKLEDVVELWLLSEDRNDLRSDIESKLENRLKIRDIVTFFLSESREEKIEKLILIYHSEKL